MNFDFEIVEPADGAYGSMKDDGSWDGMVNDLIHDVSKPSHVQFVAVVFIILSGVTVDC